MNNVDENEVKQEEEEELEPTEKELEQEVEAVEDLDIPMVPTPGAIPPLVCPTITTSNPTTFT
ncbi:hypothetical protein E2562_028643 [Oryza meyeriana var. granulata]|uniref:Uncharacterized protein n=1 Tax=Oryza meyeriana var. granulata TaxID=110450 RepID=A0A6G1DAQ1_9ORYZ|nr:hypothetical protein E2562_028643 [Oryza meyeriana var. granulata]